MPIINSQSIPRVWFHEPYHAAEDNSGPTSQYPRHGHRWTQAEITHAVAAVSSGTTISALASIFGRKPSAIDSALQKKLGRFYRVQFNVRFGSANHWMPSEMDRNSSQYPREAAPWHPDEVTYVIREVLNRTPLRHIATSIGRKAASIDQYVAREIGRDTIWSITREGALSTSDEQVASRNAQAIVMARLAESVPSTTLTPPDAVAVTHDEVQVTTAPTDKLSGMALNWAVAKAAGLDPNFDINEPAKHGLPASFRDGNGTGEVLPHFDIDWSASAGLILAEDISFRKYDDQHSVDINGDDVYFALVCKTSSRTVYWTTEAISKGATALEASLRCYVKLKLGAHINFPLELQ